MTDRANPNDTPNKPDVEKEIESDGENENQEQEIIPLNTSTPRTSTSVLDSTLEALAPLPKAPPRSQKKRGRPPGQTSILTSDAEMQRVTEKENAKLEKASRQEEKANQKKKITNKSKKVKKARKSN